MSWSNRLKDTFTFYVLSLIINQVFNSYINLLHFARISDKIMQCEDKPESKFFTGIEFVLDDPSLISLSTHRIRTFSGFHPSSSCV